MKLPCIFCPESEAGFTSQNYIVSIMILFELSATDEDYPHNKNFAKLLPFYHYHLETPIKMNFGDGGN
jgi:hypothetical protein